MVMASMHAAEQPADISGSATGERSDPSRVAEYAPWELDAIADSQELDRDGRRKRAVVRDNKGRCYTMAGMNRCAGDFTVHAGFPLSKFLQPNFHPLWFRQPDSN